MNNQSSITFQVPVTRFILDLGYSEFKEGEQLAIGGWLTVDKENETYAFMIREGIILFIAPNNTVINFTVNGVAKSVLISAEDYQPSWVPVQPKPCNESLDEPLMSVELLGEEANIMYQMYQDAMYSTSQHQTTIDSMRPKYC